MITLLQAILLILMFGGFSIFLWLIFGMCIWLYGILKERKLKKRIPDKLKQEVENERRKRELARAGAADRFREGEPGIKTADSGTDRTSRFGVRQGVQELPDTGSVQHEQPGERTERKPKKDWPSFE